MNDLRKSHIDVERVITVLSFEGSPFSVNGLDNGSGNSTCITNCVPGAIEVVDEVVSNIYCSGIVASAGSIIKFVSSDGEVDDIIIITGDS
jgi:hypothetical protein